MYGKADIGKTIRRNTDGSNPRYVTQNDVESVMKAEYATAELDPQILSIGILVHHDYQRDGRVMGSCSAISSTMNLQLWS